MRDQPDETSDQALQERLRSVSTPHGEPDPDPVGATLGRLRRRRTGRRGIWIGGVVAVLLVSAGVVAVSRSNEDQSADTVGRSDAGEPEKGVGTPIADDIEVAPGSVLLGTAFPDPLVEDRGQTSRRWRSVLLVQGDPAEVYDDYAAQLAQDAAALHPGNTLGPCNRADGAPILDGSVADGPLPEFPIECAALGTQSQLYLWHTSAAPDAPWANHIVLTVGTPDLAGTAPSTSTDLTGLGPPPGLLEDAAPPPPVPEVGDAVSPPLLDPMGQPVRVVEGSRVLAPPAPSEAATGGYVTVVRITDDPRDVVARYVEQGRDQNPETISREEYQVDGRRVLRSSWDSAGGPKLSVTATTDGRGHWYALIDVSND